MHRMYSISSDVEVRQQIEILEILEYKLLSL